MKKKIMIPIVIIALLAVSVIGYRGYQSTNRKAEVIAVSNLNIGYFGNESTSSGIVYDADNQSIYLDGTTVVSQVYVTQGQQVKAGDPLLAYDLTSLQLSVEMKELSMQQSNVQLQAAQNELNVLRNTKPVVYVEPKPTPIPTPAPKIIPVPEKVEDAYDYIVKVEQAYQEPEPTVEPTAEPIATEEPEPTAVPSEEPVETPEPTMEPEPTVEPTSEPEPSSIPTAEPSETPEVEPTAEPEKPEEKEIRFILTENGLILGKVLNELRESSYARISIETYENNKVDEAELICKWLIKTDRLDLYNDEMLYSVRGLFSQELEEEPSDPVNAAEEDIPVGYTASELASMIQDKREEIRNLDLEVRQKQLDLQIARDSLSDGVVYARRDGYVSKVSEVGNPPQDGSAFLTVTTGSGTYIQTQISELQLSSITPDMMLTITDWESNSTYMARVVSVDAYPSNASYSYSSNPNVSFYNMYAVIEEENNLKPGSWLQVAYTENVSTSQIWLTNSYIREDNGVYYVMKEENGKLVRQNVKVGASMWGEYREIKEGLTEEDYIAFPYGKNAVTGTKTVITESYGGW